jgi:archaellum component FlaG (FlaF/FlaG flagellin family)
VVVKAEGEFCFAALNVKNVGDAPASLDASCQFMVDGDSTYPPQPEAMALDDTALAGFGGEIGPGEVVQDSALYYDVPKGTHPDALELHEDCSDPGLRLPLDAALRSDRL